MKRSHTLNGLLVSLVLFILAMLVYPTARSAAQPNGLEEAWERAHEAGAYRFIADAEQTFIPRPVPSMIGQADRRVDMRMEGEVTLPDYARLTLLLEGGGMDTPSLELVQDGAETFLVKGGERVPVENPLGAVAPVVDYMGYLAAAENVQLLDDPTEEGGKGFTRYSFDIDGARFAEYVRDQVEVQLRESTTLDGQPLPPGTSFAPSPVLQRMSGHGELWVDANGLPRRQVLDLELPEASKAYDAQIHIIVDFDFEQAVQKALNLQSPTSNLQSLISSLQSNLPFLTASAVLASVLIAYRRHRWVYGLIAASVSVIMVVSPLLQVAGIVRFQERQAQAAPAETIAEALGVSTAPEKPSQQTARSTQYATRTTSSLIEPAHQCGDGTPGVDTDRDGTEDVTEYCLGTDPFYYDSDRDLITDTLEIDGFDWDGQHWTSDPFQADSNADGLADASEWPAPVGEAPDWDPDGDGIPNLWDMDNDDDGVPDDVDVSPFSRTDYVNQFSLSSQGDGFGGYQYVEVQLQPEDPDHLRYDTSTFDWPSDDQGQMQDLDDSSEDLRLVPMLEVLTDQQPALDASNYGVAVFNNTSETADRYRLLIPLFPVGDGGQIVAFYTKIPYGPGNLGNITWTRARIIWVAQAQLDQRSGGQVYAESVPLQIYTEESFRLTGLEVTKSANFESAIFGTPDYPDDDRQLFNLILGLSATFLNYQEPNLTELESRFTSGQPDPVELWGVTASVAVDLPTFVTYDHRDAGFADTSARLSDFLDDWYTGVENPAVVVAFQEDIGSYSMDDAGQFQPDTGFSVNLADISVNTVRGLKRSTYELGAEGWQELSLVDALRIVRQRYADDYAGILASLQDQYPELAAKDLQTVLEMFYAVWTIGQSRIIAVDGQPLAPLNRPDTDVYQQLAQSGLTALPTYLLDVSGLAQPGGGLRIGADTGQLYSWLRENEDADELGFVGEIFCFFLQERTPSEETRDFIIGTAIKAFKLILAVKTVVQAVQWARSASGSWSGWMNAGTFSSAKGGRALGLIGCIVSVGLIWVQFGLTTDFSDPVAVIQAFLTAVIATILTVAMFIISLNPVGMILVAIFGILDMIVYLITFLVTGEGISIQEELIKATVNYFYSVDVLTAPGDMDFINFATEKPDEGLITGSRFAIRDVFEGSILRQSTEYPIEERLKRGAVGGLIGLYIATVFAPEIIEGSEEDLNDSVIRGWLSGFSAYANTASSIASLGCINDGDTKTCSNSTKVEYLFLFPGINIPVYFESNVYIKTYYRESTLAGAIGWRATRETSLPDYDDDEGDPEPTTIYIDVLPDTVDGLWGWNAITNLDRDGDGLTNDEEAGLGTDPDDWDTDEDGLSDEFEFMSQASLGTNPNDSDTDDDGLPDGFEYRVGTLINAPDSDGDGLPDNEEIYHQKVLSYDHPGEPLGTWVGGWTVSLPNRSEETWVFSDPLAKDIDEDGLDDYSERANGISPFAYHGAPRLTLEAEMLAFSPTGGSGVYLEPGDTFSLTLTLLSVGPEPVTDRLEVCLPDFLTNVQGGDLRGDRTPLQQPAVSCANGLSWSFAGGNTLQLWEQVSTTITATISPAQSASTSGEVVASLPYPVLGDPAPVSGRFAVVVDVDDPWVSISVPANNQLLGGGIADYTIGGSAGDTSSWVDHVEVRLPGGQFVTAEGISPWAYTWNLPADGNYTLRAYACDYLGHVSPADTVDVTVDNSPPVINFPLADGTVISGQLGISITVELEGSVTDNLSGLTRVQISLDDRPWREVWAEQGTPLSVDWSFTWQLPNAESTQGEHTVAIQAFDRAGNQSDVVRRTLVVDVVPPASDLVRPADPEDPPQYRVGEVISLTGVANDVGHLPAPSRPEELVGTLHSISDATVWLGLHSIEDNDLGVSAAWLGDFNGDRLADLVLGLPAAESGAGRVTVVYGRAGGWTVPPDADPLAASLTSFVGPAAAGIGGSVIAAGDVNGDGLYDLLIGDPAGDRVYLVFGHTAALGRDLELDGPRQSTWTVLTAPAGESIGTWLGAAGDVNGDGFDDLLIGATGADGKAYLLLGQIGPWYETLDVSVEAAAVIETDAAGAYLTGVGDTNSDQRDEFVVTDGNTIYLFEGRLSLNPRFGEPFALADRDWEFSSTDVRPQVVALGDVDGDGRADFIYANGNTPQLVTRDGGGSWNTQSISGFAPAPSGFLAAPGDVDNDDLDDILVGNADGDAYLILGSDLSSVQATLTGVATAASAPYAAGADVNSDGSSDLLLVPAAAAGASLGMASAGFGGAGHVDPSALPVLAGGTGTAPGATQLMMAAPLAVTAVITRYVDDDYCDGCSNGGHTWGVDAFDWLSAAITAASAGDTIVVLPGVYTKFVVSKDDLTISGVNPDAVFVDGGGGTHAAQIQNATGVRLENMTLRNADYPLHLDSAGVGGHDDPTLVTVIDSLVIHDYTSHAVYMSRDSTAELTRCTLSGGDNHIEIYGPELDRTWEPFITGGLAINDGGGIYAQGDYIYALEGGGSADTYFTLVTDPTPSWGLDDTAPLGFGPPSAMAHYGSYYYILRADDFGDPNHFGSRVNVMAESGGDLYVGAEDGTLAKWDGNQWTTVYSFPYPVYDILISGGYIYVGAGDRLARIDQSTGDWLGLTTVYHATFYSTWEGPPGEEWQCWWPDPQPGYIYALELVGNKLYFAGDFDHTGMPDYTMCCDTDPGCMNPDSDVDSDTNNIAVYDLTTYATSKLGGTGWANGVADDGFLTGRVNALLSDGSYLYVGGRFDFGAQAGPIQRYSNNFIRYQPSTNSWLVSDGGIPGDANSVHALSLYSSDTQVMVGGSFDVVGSGAGQQTAHNLALFDIGTATWDTIPNYLSTNDTVRSIYAPGTAFYLGGDFTACGISNGISVDRVAWFQGGDNCGLSPEGGPNGNVYDVLELGTDLYVGGSFSQVGMGGGGLVHNIAYWDSDWTWSGQQFMQPTSNPIIADYATLLPVDLGTGAALVKAGTGFYALQGGTNKFYYYDSNGLSGTWTQLANVPGTVGAGGALLWVAPYVYAARGGADNGDFYRYDTSTSSWETLASLADGALFGAGAGLAWDGGDYVYALVGDGSKKFQRYRISTDQWEVLGDGSSATTTDDDVPHAIGAGGGIVRSGEYLHIVPGGGASGVWRYGPVSVNQERLTLDQVAFVAPSTAASRTWTNIDVASPPGDFVVVDNGNSDWVAGSSTTWTPTPSNSPITVGAASFLDYDHDVYRLDSGSALSAGYHTYRPDATVSIPGGGGEFTSVRDAIDSGANRVLIRPGIYQEPFYLVSGVEVLGASADMTIVERPPGNTAPALVTAEGIRGATLSRVTLAGDGSVSGMRVNRMAQDITLSRSIVRGTSVGIYLSGDQTTLEVVNNTVVGNGYGMHVDAAPVDVRNTIFAYNTTYGLSFGTAVSPINHYYNDYWGNGTNLTPATPSPSEILIEPLFVDVVTHDYRTLDSSPVIDAGDPADPAPLGTGNRVDIGYVEQGRATFYACFEYCEVCPNDGLIWGVDAFATVQSALDQARDTLAVLEGGLPEGGFTVGVCPGTYTERVSVPSYVWLVGTDADETVITASGTGSPVTFDGVVQAGVRDLTLTGAGTGAAGGVYVTNGSNEILITRNIIRGNRTGVRFDGRATGSMLFNTIVKNNNNGVVSSGSGTWVIVRNNILYQDQIGAHTLSDGQIYNDYNLFYDNTGGNHVDGAGTGLAQAPNEFDANPGFTDPMNNDYRLTSTSPAVDSASPLAAVPVGGGERADLGYRELLAAPVTLLLGQMDLSTASASSGVREVQIGIVWVSDPSQPFTATVPGAGDWTAVTLDTPGDVASYWDTSFAPGLEGLYRLYSRAADVVDNQESDDLDLFEGAFVADGTPPVVTWLSPPGESSRTAPLELRAQVSDYDARGQFNVESVHFEVGGTEYAAQWVALPWDPDSGDPRVFAAWVSPGTGTYNDVVAVAQDRAGNVGQSSPVVLTITGPGSADSTPPALTVDSPAPGSWVTATVTFAGTASDGGSGLASVEVSVDGGVTWTPANVSGSNWSLAWEVPQEQEFVSYPAQVRASDKAGNATVADRVVTVDNLCPRGPSPVTFSAPQGTHFDSPTTLDISWSPPVDGSGAATVLLAVDRVSDTVPAVPVVGTSATRTLDVPGNWYVHLAAQDVAGNGLTRHFGPWHLGTFDVTSIPLADRQQSIVLDGFLDLEHDEWRDATEFLDDAEGSDERQSFYATWDGTGLYLGWQGAWWILDGIMWAYLDTGAGGTNQPMGVQGLGALPLYADYAVMVTGPDPAAGVLYEFDGIAWQPGPLEFAHGLGGGTEIRVPLNTAELASLSLIAFAVDDDGWVWSVFPTTNPLFSPTGSTHARGRSLEGAVISGVLADQWFAVYEWGTLEGVDVPSDEQPQGASVGMMLDSPQASQATWGPEDELAYVVDLTNLETHKVDSLQLAFIATTGLTYQTVSGATCADCTTSDNWLLDVPLLPAGASQRITVTGRLAPAATLMHLQNVTTAVTLNWDSTTLAQDTLSHLVDGRPPTVTVTMLPGQAIGVGLQTIYGTAGDGDGVGVASVQCREPGSGAWQTANGTLAWSTAMTVPSAISWQLEVRAQDQHGQASEPLLITFNVDQTPPTATMDLPAILTGDYAEIGGTATDPYPTGGMVAQVVLQLDDDTAPWLPALVYAPDEIGEHGWLFTWGLPLEDGIIHTLRISTTDTAGNVGSPTAWQETLVDTIAPVVTITQVFTEVVWFDYWPGSLIGGPVLTGTVSDGGGLSEVVVQVYAPTGDSYSDTLDLDGGTWSYTPSIQDPGLHKLYVEARDLAGNVAVYGPFALLAPGVKAYLPLVAYDYNLPCNDTYEPDDVATDARAIATDGTPQHHNFHQPGDVDWVAFDVPDSSVDYVIETFDLASNADTVIYLFDSDRERLLDWNDDAQPGVRASRLYFNPYHAGTFYVKIVHYHANVGDCDIGYSIRVAAQP